MLASSPLMKPEWKVSDRRGVTEVSLHNGTHPFPPWVDFNHTDAFFFCSVRSGRQAPKQKGPGAAPDQDRVRRGHHSSAFQQHHSDVGRGPPGGEAAYHVVQRQNCQVCCLCTLVTSAHPEWPNEGTAGFNQRDFSGPKLLRYLSSHRCND